jgi:hypothetical protein
LSPFEAPLKNCVSGFVVSYDVTIGGNTQSINLTGSNNFTVAVPITTLIGVQTTTQLTIVVKSQYGEVISTVVNVTGVVTKRATIESLFTYPTITLLDNTPINMSLTNLSQNCNDFYTITLRDPTNSTDLQSSNNTAFSYSPSVDGTLPVLLSYSTSLTTIYSNKFSVNPFPPKFFIP